VTLWIDEPEGVSSRPYARPQPAALPAARAEAAPTATLRKPWWDVPTPRTPVQHPVPAQVVVSLPPWAQERAEELIRTAPTVATTGGDATSEVLTVTVLRIERGWRPANPFSQPQAGTEFLTIEVRIDNPTGDQQFYCGSQFKVAADDGTRYQRTINRTPDLACGQVLSGGSVRGWLTFEVPLRKPIVQLLWEIRFDRTLVIGL